MKTITENYDKKQGRPRFPERMKLKAFNLPVDLIAEIQKAADLDQKAGKGRGNASHWARQIFEREIQRKKRKQKRNPKKKRVQR